MRGRSYFPNGELKFRCAQNSEEEASSLFPPQAFLRLSSRLFASSIIAAFLLAAASGVTKSMKHFGEYRVMIALTILEISSEREDPRLDLSGEQNQ